MNKRIQYFRFVTVLYLLLSGNVQADWYRDSAGIMGTNIQVEVWAESQQHGEHAIASVLE